MPCIQMGPKVSERKLGASELAPFRRVGLRKSTSSSANKSEEVVSVRFIEQRKTGRCSEYIEKKHIIIYRELAQRLLLN